MWDFNKNTSTSFYLHSFGYFIVYLTLGMNLQLCPQFFMRVEGFQTFFAYLCSMFLFIFYTNLISGLRKHSFLLQNPLPNYQVPVACNRHCFPLTSLCLTPSSHIKIMGYGHTHGLLHWNPQLPLTAHWQVRWIIFHQLM